MSLNSIRAMLLDVEGTTTPISFVHEVLFPYSREHLHTFLEQHKQSSLIANDIELLKHEHISDINAGNSPPPLFEEYVYWLIDQDRKSPGLKSIQGKIWEQGYNDGALKAPVFPDVRPAMERSHDKAINISIFSSGSVLAQKLLFAHSDASDLSKLISNYFDTSVGKKNEMESYRRISAALNLATNDICFISDVNTELDAAADAGLKTLLCVRPGNPLQKKTQLHRTIYTFDEV